MAGMLWRTLLAVIAAVLIFALIPPVSRLIGFGVDGDLFTVIKIVVGGLLVYYIIRGPEVPWSRV